MTALLSVPIYQKISLTSKVMEKKYCFIVCCHAILISSQLSLHGLVIKYHELHGFRLTHKKGWFIPAGKIVFFNLIGGDEGVHYSTNHPICCGIDQRSYANSRRSVCYLPLVSVVGTF